MRYPHTRTGFDLMIPYEKKKKEESDALPHPTRSNYMNRRNRSFVAEVQGTREDEKEVVKKQKTMYYAVPPLK
jgi:hypothetical protein